MSKWSICGERNFIADLLAEDSINSTLMRGICIMHDLLALATEDILDNNHDIIQIPRPKKGACSVAFLANFVLLLFV